MGIGCGGLLLIIVITMLLGGDPTQILQILSGAGSVSVDEPAPGEAPTGAPSDELGQFASVVLASTEDTWNQLLPGQYDEPTLVLFSGMVQSTCGFNSAAVGPFYCPPDGDVYIDLSFFYDLEQRFGAPGDFAQAYVIAHEVGHHVQNLLGIAEKVTRLQHRTSEREANALSVRMELQADCFAGVWGHHAKRERNLIEPGDFEEGLRAASAIGDDRLQQQSQGYVRPESWTHGSSEQRMTWLRRGLERGDPSACNTFESATL